jgi:uncharacterized integral membrane protein
MERTTLAERIASRSRKWQIIVMGIVAIILLAVVGVGFVAQVCYALFPDAYGLVAIGHMLAGGLVIWLVSGVFVDAYLYRYWYEQVALNRIRSLVPPEDAK